MHDRLKGIFITLLSIAFLAPDSLLFRLLNLPVWDVLFWRGILVAIGMWLLLRLSRVSFSEAIFRTGGIGLYIIFFDTASNWFFYSALNHTTVANTLIILSSVSIFASIFGQIFLGDTTRSRTWGAMFILCFAVFILTSGDHQKGKILGDMLAFGAAISLAISLVAVRKCRTINMTPCVAAANLLTSIAAMPFATPMIIFSSSYLVTFLLLMGIFSTLAMICFTISPRYITAAEAALFLPLETVVGSFLVWLFVGEAVKIQTLLGGAIILSTVFFYSWRELKEAKNLQLS